jgi:hypothetical protein
MGLGQWSCGRSDGLSFNDEDFHCGSIMVISQCSKGHISEQEHFVLRGKEVSQIARKAFKKDERLLSALRISRCFLPLAYMVPSHSLRRRKNCCIRTVRSRSFKSYEADLRLAILC